MQPDELQSSRQETRNARCTQKKQPLNVSTSLPFSFYCNQLQMGVGHTGIVIQLLYVGGNITVTWPFICREGKQDGPVKAKYIYLYLFCLFLSLGCMAESRRGHLLVGPPHS